MFAVVKTGGKQYKVASGDVLQVEKLEGEVGASVALDQVLAVGGDEVKVGAPLVAGAVVNAEIVEQGKGDKVIVFKKKRRHNYRRKRGHRQMLTTIRVSDISLDGKKTAAKPAAKKADAPKAEEKKTEKKAAPKKTAAKKPAEKKAASEKKAAPKKTAAKKTTEKKAAPKKTAAKKADKE